MKKTKITFLSAIAVMALGLAGPAAACDDPCQDDPITSKGNNGWGNGNDVAPGGSAESNRAENKGATTETDPDGTAAPGGPGNSTNKDS
jgi:hypothetical protein